MNEHRKLAAIMFTDIVGYTSLMSRDENNALEILRRNRDTVKLLVTQFNGEFLKEIGDGSLSSFGSVVDAVNCALEIQNTLRDERDYKLRIGVHVGDVVVENGDVFGDGVNVASRIESLAEPGGICISERVYLDIRNKPVLQVACLGEKSLKNVGYPVKVYSLTRGGDKAITAQVASLEKGESTRRAIPLYLVLLAILAIIIVTVLYLFNAGKHVEDIQVAEPTLSEAAKLKRIAVLPFIDNSPNKDQEHLGNGITEMILIKLSSVDSLETISSTYSFSFREQKKPLFVLCDSLGIDWLLDGSIHKDANTIRITAKLSKVEDRTQIWAQPYDYDFTNVLALQDSISLAVLKEMKFTLMGKEMAAVVKSHTTDPDAWELYLKGRLLWKKRNHSSKAFDFFSQAINIDKNFALAYTGVAEIYNLTSLGLSREERRSERRKAAEKALELDDSLAEAHTVLG